MSIDQSLTPRTVAFYLPQFHQIPENDEWWGEGFTEWTNVRRAKPAFPGHYQPQVPADPPGYYDLTIPETIEWQTRTAMSADVSAFIYYHYWFDGKRLLERPLDSYLESTLAMEFAICWANENWTRRWDGKEREVLLAQRYDDTTPSAVFQSFLPYLRDSRYLRYNGKAVLLVHRVDHLPQARSFARIWREMAEKAGVGELHLVASETSRRLDPRVYGFDAVAEFSPVGDNGLSTVPLRTPVGVARNFSGRIQSYDRLARSYARRVTPDFTRHRGLIPRWDNTPRRGASATIFSGSSPQKYAAWLRAARNSEGERRGAQGLVFVNAWNEWAEGAHLEPDSLYGDEYLRATRLDYPSPKTVEDPAYKRGSINWRGIAISAASSAKTLIPSR